jgi:hypothetical protein
MREIELTRGKVALVDDEDYEWINSFNWYAQRCGGKNKRFYAARCKRINGKLTTILMHRQILKTPEGLETDHIDGDGLNNQRKNLRACSKSQNLMNQQVQKNKKHKGIFQSGKKWASRICLNKKSIYLGIYDTEEMAVDAYNSAAIKYFGEYARPN